jgi:hypothetical protein
MGATDVTTTTSLRGRFVDFVLAHPYFPSKGITGVGSLRGGAAVGITDTDADDVDPCDAALCFNE